MALEQWIEWQGGEMPVPAATYVEVLLGDDMEWDGKASGFDWSAKPDGITAYRVVSDMDSPLREFLRS